MKTTVITDMGTQHEVEAYVPLFDFQTTTTDWLKATVWAGIIPLSIFALFGAMWMMGYILIGAGVYGFARNFTPVSVLFYTMAFMVIGWWVTMGSIIALGAVSAAMGA